MWCILTDTATIATRGGKPNYGTRTPTSGSANIATIAPGNNNNEQNIFSNLLISLSLLLSLLLITTYQMGDGYVLSAGKGPLNPLCYSLNHNPTFIIITFRSIYSLNITCPLLLTSNYSYFQRTHRCRWVLLGLGWAVNTMPRGRETKQNGWLNCRLNGSSRISRWRALPALL